MSESDAVPVDRGQAGEPVPPRRRRRGLRWLSGLTAVVLIAGAVGYYVAGEDRFGLFAATEPPRPTQVAPPAGLTLPAVVAAPAVAAPVAAAQLDAAAVRAALTGPLSDSALGASLAVSVAPVADPAVFVRGKGPVTPASTMKLLTTLAALETLGPEHRFATTVVRRARQVVLVGGGDPLLTTRPITRAHWPAQADLTTLADSTAAALKAAKVTRIRLSYDTSLFTGPVSSPWWEDDYLSTDVVSPITSLWVDEGRTRPFRSARSSDPARDAAAVFANALKARGIEVSGALRERTAPQDAEKIASVQSAPLSELVEHTLIYSDNEAAEVLARQVAVGRGMKASFDGAARAVRQTLHDLGVDLAGAVIHDGSGLSRHDLLRAETLVEVLQQSAADPESRAVLVGLPVAGFNGSLADRFDATVPEALGDVRAKTGTLSGVSGLAGTATTADGVPLLFVALADKVRLPDTLAARAALDRIAAALAACDCGSS
ncbi:MAG: D-alanyl-D-alanine carboxypeptidase/D-alanyl-D-alanine-endopeptidase [Nocardioidaceae bacterium]